MGWKRQRWDWPPPQRGGTVARGLYPQAQYGAGTSRPWAQPQLLPSKSWPEPGSWPKPYSPASYDIPGNVIFQCFVEVGANFIGCLEISHTFVCLCNVEH